MKRSVALLLGALLLIGCLSCFAGCTKGPSISAEEARAAARPLIEASFALNEIYFGAGLPRETSQAILDAFLETTGQTAEKAAYLPVSRTCVYQTQADLEMATRAVYSASYAQYLIDLGFKGISDGSDDDVALGLADVVYARFKITEGAAFQSGGDVLCVRVNLDEEDLHLATARFDYDSLEVVNTGRQNGSDWVRVRLDAHVLDETGAERTVLPVTLRLLKNASGTWRLDSPTYISRSVYESET